MAVQAIRDAYSGQQVRFLGCTIAAVAWFLARGPVVDARASDTPIALATGEIEVSTRAHPGTDVHWGEATGVVDAPADQVMRVVTDYGAYQDFMPHFRTSRVLAQRGEKALVYMEALIAKGTLRVWAQLKISPEPRTDVRCVAAHMTKGNLKRMEARWEVKPLPEGRSLVTFRILVDPKIPLPASLVSLENKKASKRTIRALRERLKDAHAGVSGTAG